MKFKEVLESDLYATDIEKLKSDDDVPKRVKSWFTQLQRIEDKARAAQSKVDALRSDWEKISDKLSQKGWDVSYDFGDILA